MGQIESTSAVSQTANLVILKLDRTKALECSIRSFLALSEMFEFSLHEERILLDLTAREMMLVRNKPANALKLGGSRLERRIQDAIPILQRMTVEMAP